MHEKKRKKILTMHVRMTDTYVSENTDVCICTLVHVPMHVTDVQRAASSLSCIHAYKYAASAASSL